MTDASGQSQRTETGHPSGDTAAVSAGWAVLLSLISGGLLVLAYPKFSLGPIAWVALVPWLWVLYAAPARTAVLTGWLMGLAFFGGVLYWVALFGQGALGLLLVAALGLTEGLAVLLTAGVVCLARPGPGWPRVLLTAAAWVAWEWVRSVGQFGFPWAQLGHSQVHVASLRQIAAYAGVPGISFLVVLVNAALADAIACSGSVRGRLARLAAVGLIVLAAAGLGHAHRRGLQRHLARARADVSPLRVAIVQTSVTGPLTPDMLAQPWREGRIDLELGAYERLTRRAAARRPGLIVWPESAIPGYLGLSREISARVAVIARQSGAWLLAGGPHLDDLDRPLNSAFLVDSSGRVKGRYDKVQLVPFGEYVPGRSWLPLMRYFTVRQDDATPGAGFCLLAVDGVRLGTPICFESTFPHIARAFARNGAHILVVITNDAWFHRTAAPQQHLEIGVFRAVEQGAYLVRAAATGISCFVSPWGEVTQRAGLYEKAVLTEDVCPTARPTLYRRAGPVLPRACIALMGIWVVAALWRRRRA